MHTWILVLALAAPAAPQADLKNPKPALDAAGRAIPGHFTVTICRGTSFDMTPKDRGRDRYTTPHDVRLSGPPRGTSARGGNQGANGTIRFTSGGPGLTGPLGETTIEYDIVDASSGKKVEHLVVKVKVIDCTPPRRIAGDPAPPAPAPPATPAPPRRPGAPAPPAQPAPYRSPTHRTTTCAACADLARELNAESDRFLLAIERGSVRPDLDDVEAGIARLSQELTACETTCARPQNAGGYRSVLWSAQFDAGLAKPTGQLGKEASTGPGFGAGVTYRGWADDPQRVEDAAAIFLARFRINHTRFPKAEGMPDDFSASQTTFNIDAIVSFGDDRLLVPFVTGGAGIARNTISFGENSISSWKPGVSVGGGLDIRLNASSSLGAEVRFQKFDTFGSVTINGTYKFKF